WKIHVAICYNWILVLIINLNERFNCQARNGVKYKFTLKLLYYFVECYCGPHGKCSFNDYNKVCSCDRGFSEIDGICKECDCGSNGICSFNEGYKVCLCDRGFSEKDGKCRECYCGPHGKCSFDDYNKVCSCDRGFSEIDGICKECYCGPHGKCSFDDYNKVCSCDRGFSEIDGICKECDCGSNGICSFNEGYKVCLCDRGFSEKDGKCRECYCGPHGKCSFDDYNKVCSCDRGFSEIDGICKECYCGPHGKCSFNDYNKVCSCDRGFSEIDGICKVNDHCISVPCKNNGSCFNTNNGTYACLCQNRYLGRNCELECYCGQNGFCSLKSGVKVCSCEDGYSEINGRCQKCDCGPYGNCYFKNAKKICYCKQFFAEKFGKCIECYCGMQSWSCRFSSRGKKVCDCKPGYAQKNETCVEMCKSSSDCLNEGICRRFESGSFCDCGPYFSGDRCEKSEFCDHLKEKCEEIGAICVSTPWKATCECPKGKMFTPRGMCEDICDAAKCLYGKCEVTGKTYRCICEEGFSGLLCDINNNIKTNISIWGISLIVFCFILLVTMVGVLCCGFQNVRNNRCDHSKHF
ncbi:unnamed protein product, partial [Larinioides sclopetarius]